MNYVGIERTTLFQSHTITALDDVDFILRSHCRFGMHVAQIDLNKHGVRAHGHGQDTLAQ